MKHGIEFVNNCDALKAPKRYISYVELITHFVKFKPCTW